MDRVAAQRWFRAAAELGHGQAQLMLGRYLATGAAGERNAIEARDWLERAAEQSIAEAEFDLAELAARTAAP
jgi:TPR repeat protein